MVLVHGGTLVSLSREGLIDPHNCQHWAQWQEAGQTRDGRT